MDVTTGLIIRPGRVKNEVSFRQYYDMNWESIQPMWVFVYRKKLPLQVNEMPANICASFIYTVTWARGGVNLNS